MKRFLLFFLIILVAFISIFVEDNFFNLRTEEGSLIKEQLIKTVSAQSDPSQTKSCSCSSGGCYCEITFSNFISDGYELTSASIDVDARGDLNSGSEYITVYTDGSNRGDCCTGNCGQCSGSYANCSSYNVTTAASDDSLRVRCDASSAVNYCSTYLECRVTLSWSEQASCTPNGESCSLDSDCCSGNCAEDYEGGGKYCAPAGQCVHGGEVTTGSDSQTKTDCCYRYSGSCDASVSFNNFISSGCSLNSASLDINEGGDTNGGSEEIEYYVEGNYKKTCGSDQDWGCPIADWSNCWDGDVTSEAGDNSLTVLADGQDDADYVGVKATLSYSYSCGTLNYYNDGGCSPNGSYVCDGGDWIDHCTSGEQDCDETGVDCGGSDCASCVNPPSVETNNASNIQETQATLNGNLTDMGGASSCNVWFEWGTDTFYGNETNHTAKSSTGSFSDSITGLNSNTTYHFRAVASTSAGTSYGSDMTFTTAGSGTGGNVYGFAWIGANCTEFGAGGCGATTSPIGWVSFNSSNQGASTEYGVIADYDASPANTLRGEAWIGTGDSEENVGWLLFDENSVPSWEADSGNYARIDGNRIKGWVPIKTGGGTTLTWVKFEGSNYSNVITSDGTIDNSDSSHYAWAGRPENMNGGLGWIDLSPSHSPVILPPLNSPPEIVPGSEEIDYEEYCNIAPCTGIVGFKWTYKDPDGDPETRFDFQVDNNSDFSSPVVDRIHSGVSNPSPSDNTQSVQVTRTGGSTGSDELTYGTTYHWRVRVYDDHGSNSGWVDAGSFSTPNNAYPWPEFVPNPESPATGEEVTFYDNSVCYNGTNAYNCSSDPANSYLWDFGDGSTDNTQGTTTHTYSTPGNYTVELTITDRHGHTCTYSDTLGVTAPLPEWKETKPWE